MFEKEAEEIMRQNGCRTHSGNFIQADKVCELIQKGAEFGYNKATLKLRNCMNCKHRDTKGHSSCKDKGIVLCSHWEMKE